MSPPRRAVSTAARAALTSMSAPDCECACRSEAAYCGPITRAACATDETASASGSSPIDSEAHTFCPPEGGHYCVVGLPCRLDHQVDSKKQKRVGDRRPPERRTPFAAFEAGFRGTTGPTYEHDGDSLDGQRRHEPRDERRGSVVLGPRAAPEERLIHTRQPQPRDRHGPAGGQPMQ